MTKSHGFLRLATALTVGIALVVGLVSCTSEPAPTPLPTTVAGSAALAREQWRALVTGGSEFDPKSELYAPAIARIDEAAQEYASTLDMNAPEPWADLDTSDARGMYDAYRRVEAMALAWATHGSKWEADAAVLESAIAMLDWLEENRYNAAADTTGGKKGTGDGWWFWQLGVPLPLNTVVILLFDELTSSQIEAQMEAVHYYTPEVKGTGANRAWTALVVAQRGIILEDAEAIATAQNDVLSALSYVKSGDGPYVDGSFVQHAYIAYTGGYGLPLVDTLARLFVMLDNTRWAPTDPKIADLYSWIFHSFEPVMYAGSLMDSVRGRVVARELAQSPDAGASVIQAVLLLAESAPPKDAAALRSLAKQWLSDATSEAFWQASSIAELRIGDAVMTSTVSAATPSIGTWAFNSMDRAVHHSTEFAVAVSMSSSRIANFEAIAGENSRGWYTGDGMTYLYDAADQYANDYWPTVNPYRLPGTTVDTSTRSTKENEYLSGGTAGTVVSASGLYGTSGMALDSYGHIVTANKSWFYFDDELVALGSGISATGQTGEGWDGLPRRVETVVDNRRVAEDQVLTVDGKTVAASGAIADPAWLQLSGPGQVGYVLPDSHPVSITFDSRTGAWRDINPVGSTDPRTADYREFVIDHGTNPTDQTYSYVVLPNASVSATRSYSEAPDITVLSNTTTVSAVKENTLNVVGAQFWAGGALMVDGAAFLASDQPSAIMTEESDDAIAVTLVDPRQVEAGSVAVEINRSATAATFTSPGVTITQLSPTIRFTVDVGKAAGSPFEATFAY